MPRPSGTLRIYLGAAPGVGKTFAMLERGPAPARAGHRRGRRLRRDPRPGRAPPPRSATCEVVPRQHGRVPRRGVRGDGRRRRAGPPARGRAGRRAGPHQRPRLAATPSAGRTSRSCWTPASTSSPPSTSSTWSRSTTSSSGSPGSASARRSPTASCAAADQIELVDMTPEALRRRMAHGNVYAAETIDAALANYFRPGNLAALRELALLWVADRVDDALEAYRDRHGIEEPWETRERVVVAVTGAPGADALIRRAARIASRSQGELMGVHVRADGRAGRPASARARRQRRLLERARRHLPRDRRQRRGRRPRRLRPGRERDPARAGREPAVPVAPSSSGGRSSTAWSRLSGPIDVHVISRPPRRPRRRRPAPCR